LPFLLGRGRGCFGGSGNDEGKRSHGHGRQARVPHSLQIIGIFAGNEEKRKRAFLKKVFSFLPLRVILEESI
jgi:hypothetical protein